MAGCGLRFEVGQLVESKSFVKGYRGAWFRCKIKDIGRKKGQLGHALEFIDFPDEKVRWTKLFQKPSISARHSEMKRELMVRPQFPPIYRKNQIREVSAMSEVIVILDNVWKVGDLVDWWTDGCYWSGKVTEIQGDEKIRIELLPPPFGEGMSYDVFCKDLRPSLDWSLKSGWTVPIPMENANNRQCARVIKLASQGPSNLTAHNMNTGKSSASFTSQISPDRLLKLSKRPVGYMGLSETHTPEVSFDLDIAGSGTGRTSCSDSVSSSLGRDASINMEGTATGLDQDDNDLSSKKMKIDIPLNSTSLDTLEAAILDLEELTNRVKWIKGILEFGMPIPSAVRPCWEFLEHRATGTPK